MALRLLTLKKINSLNKLHPDTAKAYEDLYPLASCGYGELHDYEQYSKWAAQFFDYASIDLEWPPIEYPTYITADHSVHALNITYRNQSFILGIPLGEMVIVDKSTSQHVLLPTRYMTRGDLRRFMFGIVDIQ